MKILLVHNYYKIPGGEDTVVVNEKELLEAHGHTVILYLAHNSELDHMNIGQKLLLPFSTCYSFKHKRELIRVIQKEGIELVHVHNTFPLISPSVYDAAKKCRIPVVQTLHNFRLLCPSALLYREGNVCRECLGKVPMHAIWHKCYRDSVIQSGIVTSMLAFHRITGSYRKVDAYIALTTFNRDIFSKYLKVEQQRIYVKPNFMVELPRKEATDAAEPSKADEYYLYAGRISKEKGIPLLLETFAKLTDVQLRIAGAGELETYVKHEIEQKQLFNICYLGYQEHDEIIRLLRGAKAMIMPSQCYEGFPMGIVESFSVGTPVIAGNIGNPGQIIEEGQNGFLFQYDSTEALCSCIRGIESKEEIKEKIKKMRKSTYQIYQEKYTAEKNYAILEEIYKENIGTALEGNDNSH